MKASSLFDSLPITLESHWEEFDTPEKWMHWLALYRERENGPSGFEDLEGCLESGKCAHLDAGNFWCRLRELPATFNPVLRDLGMACCGFGHSNSQAREDSP